MKYKQLFDISIAHSYYEDGMCPDLPLVVSAESEALVRKHRLVVKERRDGVTVLIAVNAADAPFVPFPAGAALTFVMRAPDEDFHCFTETGALTAMKDPVFFNAAGVPPLEGGTLSFEDRSPSATVRKNIGNLAKIEISGLKDIALSSPPSYEVVFSPRAARWVYYVITDVPEATGTGVLTIADTDASPIAFGASNTRDLIALPDDSDPVGTALAARHSGKRLMRFVSDAPVTASAKGHEYLELCVDGAMVQEALPNPSIRAYTRIEIGDPAAAEDAFYAVIEHIVQAAASQAA